MKENKKIAIIFFSLEAREESRFKKFFALNDGANDKINASLISETKKALQSTDLPIFHYHQGKQIGNSFGERLANAYQEVFDLGFEAIISVGNDSPEINQLDWKNITDKLQKGHSVIGPNLRGGTYLIGINRSQFHKSSFASLPWQSAKLFKALISYTASFQAPIILKKIRDINTLQDLRLLIKDYASFKKLSQLIKLILSSKIFKYLKQQINLKSLTILPGAPFRAPPQLF